MATVTRPATPLPNPNDDMDAEQVRDWTNNILSFLEGTNIDEANVDLGGTDGILGKSTAQSITGLKSFESTLAAAGGVREVVQFGLNPSSGTQAASDGGRMVLYTEDDGGGESDIAYIDWVLTTATAASEVGRLDFYVAAGGAPVSQIQILDGALQPTTDSDVSLGVTGTRWSNLFVDAATIGGALTLAGAIAVDDTTDTTSTLTGSIQTDGGVGIAKAIWVGTTSQLVGNVTFGGNALLTSNDNGALGASGTAWSDLFLANEAVIDFNAGTDQLIHGGSGVFRYETAQDAGQAYFQIRNSAAAGSTDEFATLSFAHVTSVAGRISSIREQDYSTTATKDSSLVFYTALNNADTEVFRIDSTGLTTFVGRVITDDTTDTTSTITGSIQTDGGVGIAKALWVGTTSQLVGNVTFGGSALLTANDNGALGAGGTAWSDLFLADGAVINFGNGGYTLTHAAGSPDTLTISGGDFLITGGSIELDDSESIILGTGNDATISYNGTDLVISPAAVGVGDVYISGGSVEVDDSESFTLGTGKDATISYDGTDLTISPAVVGSGDLIISGASIEFDDSEGVTLGTGKDATLQYDGTDLIISPAAVGTGDVHVSGGSVEVDDSESFTLGTGKDATISYDGTDLTISPAAVGSGDLIISGASIEFDDSEGVTLGTGKDATLQYDGTHVVMNTQAVGSGNFNPGGNDGGAIGTSGTAWSDLFLASGAVINFNAGAELLTHDTGILRFEADRDGAATSIFIRNSSAAGSTDETASLNFNHVTSVAGKIESVREQDYSNNPTKDSSMVFYTALNNIDTEVLRIDSLGLATFAGRVITNDTTDTSSTVTGSIQTDGGVGVALGLWVGGVSQLVGNVTFGGAALLTANDNGALGASGTAWSDLFLASGGVINWNSGAETLTDVTGGLQFDATSDGGDVYIQIQNAAGSGSTDETASLFFSHAGNQGGKIVSIREGDYNGGPAQDSGMVFYTALNGTNEEVFRISSAKLATFAGRVITDDATDTSSAITGSIQTDGGVGIAKALWVAGITTMVGAPRPSANDGAALGIAGTAWADLFLASGAVVNFNNGGVTLTHAASELTLAGGLFKSSNTTDTTSATTGSIQTLGGVGISKALWVGTTSRLVGAASFTAAPRPTTNDGAALGISGTAWADLFLATGAVINFNAGTEQIVHQGSGIMRYEADRDGALTSFQIRNTAAAGSTDETVQLSFAHVTSVAGSIRSLREQDYSTTANKDSSMVFLTATNNLDTEAFRIDSNKLATFVGRVITDDTTDTTSTTTGSIQTDGGLGIAKALYVGTTSTLVGQTTIGHTSQTGTGLLAVVKSAATAEATIETYSVTDSHESQLTLSKSSSATIGTDAETASGERLGRLLFFGVNSSSSTTAAAVVSVEQTAAAGASFIPGDIIFSTATATATATQRVRISSSGVLFTGGETTNANMSNGGITIQQGAADDQAFCIKSSTDVVHGITTIAAPDTETDDYFTIAKREATTGGVQMNILAESTEQFPLRIEVFGGDPTTDNDATSDAMIEILGTRHDGANAISDMSADTNLFALAERDASSGARTRLLLKADDGELHLGNSTVVGLDFEDDNQLVRAMQKESSITALEETEYDNPFYSYSRLHELGLASKKDESGFFLFPLQSRLHAHEGAMWQTYCQMKDMAAYIEQQDKRIEHLETLLLER